MILIIAYSGKEQGIVVHVGQGIIVKHKRVKIWFLDYFIFTLFFF